MLISALIVLAICHLIAAIGFHHNTHTPLHCVAFSHSPIFCLTLSSNSFRSTPLQFNYIYKYNCLLLHFISSVFINLFTKRVFGFVAILRVCVCAAKVDGSVGLCCGWTLFIYLFCHRKCDWIFHRNRNGRTLTLFVAINCCEMISLGNLAVPFLRLSKKNCR